MLIRTISALIGAPLVLGLVYLGGAFTAFLVSVISIVALNEYLQIGAKMGIAPWNRLVYPVAIVWLLTIFLGYTEWLFPIWIFWLLITMGALALNYPKIQFPEALYNFLSVVYTVALLSHLYLLRTIPQGLEWTFFTLFLVWSTDTGAYLIGRAFGKRHLAPAVSPKKTVEGAIGGLLFASVVSLILAKWIGGSSWVVFLLLGTIVGVSAQIGDLFESALKRSAQVKDSGHLIPGHGGFLDRFDSLIFAIPLVYYGVVLGIVR
ncbi:MAG: phosphatidate cytidylyltransferase [Desulfitobacterium hafniense]|nr:phosphatidate cytidylyltransferase [Desulfitobacterium hafniense]